MGKFLWKANPDQDGAEGESSLTVWVQQKKFTKVVAGSCRGCGGSGRSVSTCNASHCVIRFDIR